MPKSVPLRTTNRLRPVVRYRRLRQERKLFRVVGLELPVIDFVLFVVFAPGAVSIGHDRAGCRRRCLAVAVCVVSVDRRGGSVDGAFVRVIAVQAVQDVVFAAGVVHRFGLPALAGVQNRFA